MYEAVKERGSRAFFAVVALVPAGSAKVEKQVLVDLFYKDTKLIYFFVVYLFFLIIV